MRFLLIAINLVFFFSVSAQKNISLLSKLPYSVKLSNVWGYTDETNIDYALVGVEDGLSIVSLQNPNNPQEIKKISGTLNSWREIKTFGDYAYISSESGDGLLIVDLSPLPTSTALNYVFKTFTKQSKTVNRAHTLEIDDKGFCYLFGTDRDQETVILDLNADPMNPIEVGSVGLYYAHDGIVKGDTLYQAHIGEGMVGVYNLSNKANPVFVTSFSTPLNFTHNIALSDDGKYLFATDEKAASYIAAYDVSDLSNIKEIDRFQRETENFSMVHNTHQLNGYLINSYYLEGINIVDAHEPNNLVEVGHYDTTPLDSGYTFSGVWGVFPYFSSGLILASDINQGLYIFSPSFQRAAYLSGTVNELGTSTPLNNVKVSIVNTDVIDFSNFSGLYNTGYQTTGTYTIKYSKVGYYDTTITVNLVSALVQNANIFLRKKNSVNAVFKIINLQNKPIVNSNVLVKSEDGAEWLLTYANTGVLSASITGVNFNIDVGKWGYKTQCIQKSFDDFKDTIQIVLHPGIYDDFTFDFGWTTIGDALKGGWVRELPYGTLFAGDKINANEDVLNDCNGLAYITGNPKNPDFTFNKVDQTPALLASPNLDISSFVSPHLSFYLWFVDYDKWEFANDSAFVFLESNSQKIFLDTIIGSVYKSQAIWKFKEYDLTKYNLPFSQFNLKISAVDSLPHNALELGFDMFQLSEGSLSVAEESIATSTIFPNPSNGHFEIVCENNLQKLKISDVEGRVIFIIEGLSDKHVALKLDAISSGMYFIEVEDDFNQHFTHKLLISAP